MLGEKSFACSTGVHFQERALGAIIKQDKRTGETHVFGHDGMKIPHCLPEHGDLGVGYVDKNFHEEFQMVLNDEGTIGRLQEIYGILSPELKKLAVSDLRWHASKKEVGHPLHGLPVLGSGELNPEKFRGWYFGLPRSDGEGGHLGRDVRASVIHHVLKCKTLCEMEKRWGEDISPWTHDTPDSTLVVGRRRRFSVSDGDTALASFTQSE